MTKSLAEIIKESRVGIDEFDVRYWVQRYIRDLVGGSAECREVKGGRMVLWAAAAGVRQELILLTEDIKAAAHQQTGYQIKEVEVRY